MTDESSDPDPELAEAVEDALNPATHDAVMALWQRVVLGRLDREQPPDGDDEELRELLRRLRDGEPPEAGPSPGGPPT